jgi:tRNA (cytidine/uridine-2'-O-)-methyltransferase
MKIALFQPEIAVNVGNIIRSCACFGSDLHIIEPCGFPFDINKIKKSALDYYNLVNIERHNSFSDFFTNEIVNKKHRLILATTKSNQNIKDFTFLENDIVLFGQESSGVPTEIRDKCHDQINIKIKNNTRSLNLAISCGIVLYHTTSA